MAQTQKLVVMGVSGCGKSSVGAALAQELGCRYQDGDDLHPAENIARMGAGIPLTDADRWPWLDRVALELQTQGGLHIVGCSALKRSYRDRIRAGVTGPVTFIHLAGTRDLIAGRMRDRPGHFMPTSLLDSQFATLEPPTADEHAITADIDQPLRDIVSMIIAKLEEHHDE